MPESAPGPRPRRMLDRYELVAEIAQGGMGAVYLARLQGVGGFERLFAIKLLHPHLAEDGEFVSMLIDEARLAAKLHHPNAVAISDVCTTAAGYYLVMEYVDGFTLNHVLRYRGLEPRRRVRLGLRILLDAANGLDAAHRLTDHDGNRLGIVHRDVSPQNVLVGCDGIGRITDFGIARAAARITASRPGIIKGKPCYMAPEQARGQELDARADVFALGTILWEVLAGDLLFYDQEGDMATLMRVMTDEVRPPSTENEEIGPALDEVCLRALERERDKRYPTARALVAAVEEAARDAKLLASHHEVADAILELFAEQLERRRTAIKKHLAELGPEAGPVVASDVFSVPKLPRSNAAAEPAWHETSDAQGTSATKPATPASLQVPVERPNRTAKLDKAQLPAPSTPPAATGPAPAPKGGRPLVLAGVLLGAVGVLLLVAWIALLPGEDDPAAAGTVTAGPSPVPPPSAAMEEVAPEPVVEPPPLAMEEEAAAPVVEEPPAVVEPPPAATERRGSGRPGSGRSGTGRTDPVAGSDRTPTMDESPPSMETRPPAIEDNPYLRR